MLSSAGVLNLKSGDRTRNSASSGTGTPSTDAFRVLSPTSSTIRSAQASRSSCVPPWNGGGSTSEHSVLRSGKNSRRCDGTVQLRVAGDAGEEEDGARLIDSAPLARHVEGGIRRYRNPEIPLPPLRGPLAVG